MALAVYCGHCEAKQPNDWQAGDSCISCGLEVRKDLRCTWCVQLTPDGKFCKHCGSEIQEERYFGPARILKNLGVNQFDMPAKLHSLAPEKIDQYQRQFNQHYAHIQAVIEELKPLEQILIGFGQEHYHKVETELLEKLPFPDEMIKKFEAKKGKLFDPDRKDFPFDTDFPGKLAHELILAAFFHGYQSFDSLFFYSYTQAIIEYAIGGKTEFKEQFAILLAHPTSTRYTFNWPQFIDPEHYYLRDGKSMKTLFMEVLEPLLTEKPLWKPYAAVAIYNLMLHTRNEQWSELGKIREMVLAACDHPDPQLRFTAAVLLDRQDRIIEVAQLEQAVGAFAFEWLMERKHPAIAELSKTTLTSTQYLSLEKLLNRNYDYDAEVRAWAYQKEHLDEKWNKKLSKNAISSLSKEEIDLLQKEKELDYQELQSRYPLSADLRAEYSLMAPAAWARMQDERCFAEDIVSNGNKQAFFPRMLRFALEYGKLSQTALDRIVALCEKHQQQKYLLIFTEFPRDTELDYQLLAPKLFRFDATFLSLRSGFATLETWVNFMENGFFPSIVHVKKVFRFFDIYDYHFIVNEDQERGVFINFFHQLMDAGGEYTYLALRYWLEKTFDEGNIFMAIWFGDNFIAQGFFKTKRSYSISDSESPASLEFGPHIIEDFFDGNEEKFLSVFEIFCAVGGHKCYGRNDILNRWVDSNPEFFGDMLSAHPQWAQRILDSQREANILGYSLQLAIKDSKGQYPLMDALGDRVWDMGEVQLYDKRPDKYKTHHHPACLERLCDWLLHEGGIHFHSPIFESKVKHYFRFTRPEQVQKGLLSLWIKEGAASQNDEKKLDFYSNSFSSMLSSYPSKPLPAVLDQEKEYPLQPEDILNTILGGPEGVLDYATQNFKYGLESDSSCFVLHALCLADDALFIDHLDPKQTRAMMENLYQMALNPLNKSNTYDRWLPPLVDLVQALGKNLENKKELFDIIWSFNGIHYSIGDKVTKYLKANMKAFMEQDPFPAMVELYCLFEDLYFSNRHDMKWVMDLLNEELESIVQMMVDDPDLQWRITELITENLVKAPHIAKGGSDQKRLLDQLNKHFLEILKSIPAEHVSQRLKEQIKAGLDNKVFLFPFSNYIEEWFEQFESQIEEEEEIPVEDTGSVNRLAIPEDLDYDADEITFDLQEISSFMARFKVDQQHITDLINHLPYYKKDRTDNPMMLSILMMHQHGIKAFVQEEMMLGIQLYQKLFEILIDPLCASDGPFASYGQLTAMLFPQLLQGSIFAAQYSAAIQSMMLGGSYSEPHQAMLQQLYDQIVENQAQNS